MSLTAILAGSAIAGYGLNTLSDWHLSSERIEAEERMAQANMRFAEEMNRKKDEASAAIIKAIGLNAKEQREFMRSMAEMERQSQMDIAKMNIGAQKEMAKEQAQTSLIQAMMSNATAQSAMPLQAAQGLLNEPGVRPEDVRIPNAPNLG